MGERMEGVHAGVLLHGGRQVELGRQVGGVGQDGSKFRVRHKALHITLGVAQHVRHLADVQHVDLAACAPAAVQLTPILFPGLKLYAGKLVTVNLLCLEKCNSMAWPA